MALRRRDEDPELRRVYREHVGAVYAFFAYHGPREVAEDLTSEAFEQVLSDDALRAWLAPLSEREREVVALRYAAELPATEIAAITGLSAANVHQIASRALRRLRELAGVSDSA